MTPLNFLINIFDPLNKKLLAAYSGRPQNVGDIEPKSCTICNTKVSGANVLIENDLYCIFCISRFLNKNSGLLNDYKLKWSLKNENIILFPKRPASTAQSL